QKGNKKEDDQKKESARRDEPISYLQARAFKEKFDYPATVSISVDGGGMATVFHQDKKTDPNVRIIGGDENYLQLNGYTLQTGRNFNPSELHNGSNVAIIGMDVATKLYGSSLKGIENSN